MCEVFSQLESFVLCTFSATRIVFLCKYLECKAIRLKILLLASYEIATKNSQVLSKLEYQILREYIFKGDFNEYYILYNIYRNIIIIK